MAKDFNLERDVIKRKTSRKPQLVLSGFGLQAVKAKVYNFGEEDNGKESGISNSYLGTPIFANVVFPKGKYRNLEGEEISFEGVTIDTVLVSVNQSKNIIKTNIQGRNGSIKEFISDGDYDISLRGLIADQNANRYPEEEVLKLIEICKVQDSLKIESRFLNDVFGISNLVIESYAIPQTEGMQNVQIFELSCSSDDPIELTINE